MPAQTSKAAEQRRGGLAPQVMLHRQRLARAHAKDHELKAAVYAYRQAVLQGVADTETALGDLHQSRQREMALDRAVAALDTATAAVRRRQQLGLASKLQVQDQQIRQQQAEQALVAARASRDLAYVALYKALGGAPLPPAEADHARAETSSAPAPAKVSP